MAETQAYPVGMGGPKAPNEGLWQVYVKTRTKDVREQLLNQYLPLLPRVVERIARRLPAEVEVDDLIQQGVFGLMDAVDSFDPERGVKFSTFAGQRVRGAVLDYLRSIDWAPRLARTRSKQYEAARQQLSKAMGTEPTQEDIRKNMHMGQERFDMLLRDAQIAATSSLYTETHGQAGEPLSLIDALPDDRGEAPFDVALRKDLRNLINQSLSRAERLILTLYYFEQMTMKEIGTTLDLSESRVSQMHSSILARLSAQLHHRNTGKQMSVA